jgi:uncharacterized phage protein (TIGR02218 family)
MKDVGDVDDYIEKYIKTRRFAIGELYTFNLVNGDSDYFTNLDFTVPYGGVNFRGTGLVIEGLHYKISTGWNTDEQNVKILFRPDNTLAGAIFSEAVTEGLLDGATVIRQRALWTHWNNIAQLDYSVPPDRVITLFTGTVSTIEKIGRTAVELKVVSPMKLLDLDMPRNNYQSSCQWALFDQGCTKNRADYTTIGTISSLVGDYGIVVSGGITPATLDATGDPWYADGRIHFTSGAMHGLSLSLRTNDDTSVYFMYPPIVGLEVGDTFEMWPGCMKRTDTCQNKFDNLPNFRGFPRVPPIHVSL